MKIIQTRFKSKCAETGEPIPKGVNVLYDSSTKKVYSLGTKKYDEFTKQADDADAVNGYIEAQENAYCDNRYRG